MDKAQLWHGNISRWQRRQMGKIFHTETFEAKFLCQGDRQEQTGQFASPGSAATLSPASSTAHSFHFQKLHLLWNLPTVLQLRILVVWELGGLVHWTHAMYEPLLNSVSSFDAHVYHTNITNIRRIWLKSFPVGNFISSMSHRMMVSGRSGRALINTNADKSFKQLILSRGKNRNRIEAKPSSFEKVGYTDGAAHHIIVIALELLLLHPPDASFFATSPISLHLIPLWGRFSKNSSFSCGGRHLIVLKYIVPSILSDWSPSNVLRFNESRGQIKMVVRWFGGRDRVEAGWWRSRWRN